MVNTTDDWNNDLGDDEVETDFFDDDTDREDHPEKPFVYSPFSPYYEKKQRAKIKDYGKG